MTTISLTTGRAAMAERRFLVCGGCGFIGSHLVRLLHSRYSESRVTVLDLLTYAGSLDNLEGLEKDPRVTFIKGDISRTDDLKALKGERFDLTFNFAAETHVDRSFYYSGRFVETNVYGTHTLLEYCRCTESPFVQISTDEVYGPASSADQFDENAPLNPTSPYAASKAGADLLVLAAFRTFRQQVCIVRTCNNYGPRQFPEKLIPYFISLARDSQALPLYGDGQQRRRWLHVSDFCAALLNLVDRFPTGEILNIGSSFEISNLELTERLVRYLRSDSTIQFVEDRPGHDRGYRIDSTKYTTRYGAIGERDFDRGLRETIDWYLSHQSIFERLLSPETRLFLQQHYSQHS